MLYCCAHLLRDIFNVKITLRRPALMCPFRRLPCSLRVIHTCLCKKGNKDRITWCRGRINCMFILQFEIE